MTERVEGYDTNSILCVCGDLAFRQAVYQDQFTITETGAVVARKDRLRRDHLGEKLNGLYKRSVAGKRETGAESGPFKLPESKTYGPK